ncbi:MAG: zinc-dependent metalloprotease [Halobacteriaceae archaeon]
MGIYHSVRAVAGARGDGAVDWTAVSDAAKSAIQPGDLDLDAETRTAYRDDAQAARARIRAVSGLDFEIPDAVTVQDRHHWIDANVATFRRLLAPLDEGAPVLPGVARVANTGSMAAALAFLGNNVLGQYDPLLLADGDPELYVVHPNVGRTAAALELPVARFRRWIVFHEVTHAAEFEAAPWLADYLEDRVTEAVDILQNEGLRAPRGDGPLGELDTAMTAVEGYAELLMDEAFDEPYADLRAKLEARRNGGGPVTRLLRRLLGLGLKRRQYERGAAFFEAIAEARGVEGAGIVWERPETLPTDAELDDPASYLDRIE